MKTKLIALFALMMLFLVVKFTPTAQEHEETEFQELLNDTTLINHSEIQVQELSESEMYYRQFEPRYLNND